MAAKKALRVVQAESQRQLHVHNPEQGVSLEDVMQPSYWVHVTKKLHKTDRIEVIPEDGSWYAELMVLSVEAIYAKVILLKYLNLAEEAAKISAPAQEYFVKYGNNTSKHRIIRKSDNKVLKEGFNTAAEATQYLDDHLKQVAA